MNETGEADRRAALLKQLADFAQRGIDKAVRISRKRYEQIPDSASRSKANRLAQVHHLESKVPHEIMSMLDSYDTGTLEQVALSFTGMETESDYLHSWLSYNGKEWNKVTGVNRDVMFRDILALRYTGWSKAESRVHSLLDTYRALKLQPGSIHLMDAEHVRVHVGPVFLAACASRSTVWLRRGVETKRLDSNEHWIPPVEPEVHEDYTRSHLTSEAVQYIKGFPERYTRLWLHMKRHKQTLPEVDFELFLIEEESHASLVNGVL